MWYLSERNSLNNSTQTNPAMFYVIIWYLVLSFLYVKKKMPLNCTGLGQVVTNHEWEIIEVKHVYDTCKWDTLYIKTLSLSYNTHIARWWCVLRPRFRWAARWLRGRRPRWTDDSVRPPLLCSRWLSSHLGRNKEVVKNGAALFPSFNAWTYKTTESIIQNLVKY